VSKSNLHIHFSKRHKRGFEFAWARDYGCRSRADRDGGWQPVRLTTSISVSRDQCPDPASQCHDAAPMTLYVLGVLDIAGVLLLVAASSSADTLLAGWAEDAGCSGGPLRPGNVGCCWCWCLLCRSGWCLLWRLLVPPLALVLMPPLALVLVPPLPLVLLLPLPAGAAS
jgi:hypothetical protein